jgi:hypothetical protein
MRYRAECRDVPLEEAARRLGVKPNIFADKLPNLFARGFPRPDPDRRNFDLQAMTDGWIREILICLESAHKCRRATQAPS